MFVNFKKVLFFICFFISSIYAETLSVMTLNVENLFDTFDDLKKDDKAFLPIEMKQSKKHKNSCNSITVNRWRMECFFQDWNEDTKNAKLQNLVKVIISFDKNGADVIGLQEIENMNILEQLFNLLEPYGYYVFDYFDEQGWPHYTIKEALPNLKAGEQSILMKEAIVNYFLEQKFIS